MLERISKITERWFLSEEALFMTFCTHRVAENSSMHCPVRVGKGVIEVNPDLCADMTDKQLEEHLRVEVIRILLKHPYDRQPDGCSTTARALGSNCVIGDAYPMLTIDINHPADFRLPTNGHYEFYARHIQRMINENDNGNVNGNENQNENEDGNVNGNENQNENEDENGNENSQQSGSLPSPLGESEGVSDLAQNWEQDDLMAAQVNEVIRDIKSWGSVPGNLVEQIIASTKARIDYRKVLAGFRASVISQARRLTRMRPNRRSGFEAMGSRYDFTTSLIIGVDVSGSISSEDLQNFYTTINHFFQYGIQQIDVIQFDTALGEVQTISKASENITVTGRGGTDFQPFIDFVANNPQYDGAIIYTDGYASQPSIPSNMYTPLCWILRSEEELKEHEQWMSQSGRVCVIENN